MSCLPPIFLGTVNIHQHTNFRTGLGDGANDIVKYPQKTSKRSGGWYRKILHQVGIMNL